MKQSSKSVSDNRRESAKKMECFFKVAQMVETIEQLKEVLAPVLPLLKEIYPGLAEYENDYRSGNETYGYENMEHILGWLYYISDRWRCAFRVRWLIDLADIPELPQNQSFN